MVNGDLGVFIGDQGWDDGRLKGSVELLFVGYGYLEDNTALRSVGPDIIPRGWILRKVILLRAG